MKTSVATACALFSLTLFSAAPAQAAEHIAPMDAASVYNCELSGDMQGVSVAVFFGGEVISGTGYLTCTNSVTRQYMATPVKLALIGGGVGFDFTIIRRLTVRSANVRVSNPAALMQTFALGASAGVTLLRAGVGFDVAATLTDGRGLGFDVGFTGQDAIGIGARLYAMTFSVQRL